MSALLVIASALDGQMSRSALELVGGARALAGPLGGTVAAALLGAPPAVSGAAEVLHQHGVSTVYRVAHDALTTGQSDAVLEAAQAVVQRAEPAVVFITADTVGREVAPRLAYRMRAALATEAMSVEADGQTILVRRQVYGGRAVATLAVTARPAVLSVKPRTLDVPGPSPAAGTVVDVPLAIDPARLAAQVRDRQRQEAEVSLEDAPIVVGGGRGVGGPEGFRLLGELAKALGGAVGSSRPPADEGWVPITWQIGQTGKSIRPNLYIAVGISGAAQHVAGVSGARTIVAINKDPEAPIFSLAHFGLVGDFKQIVPALLERLRAVKGA
ncbi:MAG TPA: electron transfer flavoprotein subunit alpha/FixB family protein [bacterium]|nr:electron transfer flavoprotein subunit alpha/FixB family protein [bacterium]